MLRHNFARLAEREVFRQYRLCGVLTGGRSTNRLLRWRRAFTRMGLVKGERVAMLLSPTASTPSRFGTRRPCAAASCPRPFTRRGLLRLHPQDSNARFLKPRGQRLERHRRRSQARQAAMTLSLHERAGRAQLRHAPGRQGHRPFELEDWLATGEGVSDDELPPEPWRRRPSRSSPHSGTTAAAARA